MQRVTASGTGTSLDLGDRTLELVHPGRGHTGGDALVLVREHLAEAVRTGYAQLGLG